MTLREYLTREGIKAAPFGRQVGVPNRMTMLRYVQHQRMPPHDVLHRIREVTGGEVTADDFVTGLHEAAKAAGVRAAQARRTAPADKQAAA